MAFKQHPFDSIDAPNIAGRAVIYSPRTTTDGSPGVEWPRRGNCERMICRTAPDSVFETARDHPTLNFASVFVDLRISCVSVVPLCRIVLKVTVAAVSLDRLSAWPLRYLGRAVVLTWFAV